MSDGGLPARSPRAGRSGSLFPKSFRAIFRGASSLASTVRSAGSSVASSISSVSDDPQREQVTWAGFDKIELEPGHFQRVLLLTYVNGFQVWNIEDANVVWELVSKRDGSVAFLRVHPLPVSDNCSEVLNAARPLLLVVTSDTSSCRSAGIPSRPANGYNGVVVNHLSSGESYFNPTLVKFYSLRSHTYVHTLRFRTAIHAVRCSPRVVAVALATQVYCFDAATLENTFSMLTYPSPGPGPNGLTCGYGALAVGPRWLAYAANQPPISNTGRVSPQHLSPSPGVSPSTSPASGSLVAHYAKESSKQLAAGIVTLGDLGYKAFSKYCTEGTGSPEPGSPLQRSNGIAHLEHAGTVIVRDFVNKAVVSHFRAHESPLSALCFDPTGTLLVSASIYGHNINVFRIMPVINTNGSYDANSSHVHLYKLSRGVTNAIIQDIAFSEDSHWIVVSSSRGTSHLFSISPFGGATGPTTHSGVGVSSMRLLPWWSNLGPVRSIPQASPSPPTTVNSSVVSRIKNGNAGWRGTVSGAAAAASGRSCGSVGAVAICFHDGQGHKLDSEAKQTSLKEQLWVLSPSGHLIRYALHLSAVTEEYGTGRGMPGSPREIVETTVVVEPLQKWDLSRKANYMEREEKIDGSHEAAQSASKASGTSLASYYGSGTASREEVVSEERHQWFLSNAEVQMHHFRPPVWAKPQVSFHVFSSLEQSDAGGEHEIEKVPARLVVVKNKDLVPVLDRLRNFQFGEENRNRTMLWEGTLNVPSQHPGMTYGFIRPDVGGARIQRSSSGSSCGSDGSSYCGPHVGQNGVHHALQESPQDHNYQLVPFSESNQSNEKSKLQNAYFSSIDSVKGRPNTTLSNAESPPFVISYLTQPDPHNGVSKRGEKLQGMEGALKDMRSTSGAGSIHNGFLPARKEIGSAGFMPNNTAAVDKASPHTPGSSDLDEVPVSVSIDAHAAVGKFGLQEYDGTAEDVDSTDGNSKSEDFGGEQGEDGWEGGLFPFAEDC